MIEDESEVFEITDFTTASEWERYVARLEEILHDWKLTGLVSTPDLKKGELCNGQWEETVESLEFADFKFVICNHKLKQEHRDEERSPEPVEEKSDTDRKDEGDTTSQDVDPLCWQDMMSTENDFPSRGHCLCRWYGLRQFLVIAPAPQMVHILSEARANIILSSIAIAAVNTGCTVPIFIQVHEKWRKLFYGQMEFAGFRTNFEMIHFRNVPHQYSYLSGLLDVFKSKLVSPISSPPPVSVSVRFTYILQDWVHYSWPQAPPDFDSVTGCEVGIKEFGELPFGACEDPVSSLQLATTWPNLSEEMIVDSDIYSDLDPMQAPHWSVKVIMSDSPQCLMGTYLQEFVELCKKPESTEQLLGKSVMHRTQDSDVDLSQALHRLTDPGYSLPVTSIGSSLGTVVTRATSKLEMKPEDAPIPLDQLNEILQYLFPDAAESKKSDDNPLENGGVMMSSESTPSTSTTVTPAASPAVTPSTHQPPETSSSFTEMFKQFKSAPLDSLVSRLAVVMTVINHSCGRQKAVAHLWQEFVLEMRYRLEQNYIVPLLELGAPNMGCSLLYQKLQMLNCCIERKIAREKAGSSPTKSPYRARSFSGVNDRVDSMSDKSEFSTSSDDEFFDFADSDEETEESLKPQRRKKSSTCDTDTQAATSQSEAAPKTDEQMEVCDSQSDSSSIATGDINLSRSSLSLSGAPKTDRSDSVSSSSRKSAKFRVKSSQSAKASDSETEMSFTDSFTHQPEGRQKQFGELKLLNHNEFLYVPITQEPAPMTEDQLEEHAEVLAKLGTSAEGAHLRARLQSACLLSDMEAFKAANPGATLGDFVRWYSPRDWVEEEGSDDLSGGRKGQLSQRMQIPGNMWVEVWQSAKPVPARRQRRLFDDTKEAEKVLQWLSVMNPADVAMHLMPMLIHVSITNLMEKEQSSVPVLKRLIDQISSKAAKVMRGPRPEVKKFEDIMHQLGQIEIAITRAQSLQTKFSQEAKSVPAQELQKFVAALLEQPEVEIAGATRVPIGSVVAKLFTSAHQHQASYLLREDEEMEHDAATANGGNHVNKTDFPPPIGKEYILRTRLQHPAPWSREAPQRMYCVLLKDKEFRLAGAFSTDTTFQ